METETIRLSKEIVEKVRQQKVLTGINISFFIEKAIEEKLAKSATFEVLYKSDKTMIPYSDGKGNIVYPLKNEK